MTLTFKMATTGKWTNLTQKVAKVKLFEWNHQQNIGQKQHHQNTQVKLPTCSLYNPWHYDLSAHYSLRVECAHLWVQCVCVCVCCK